MSFSRFLVALGLMLAVMAPARAGILFGKKQNPAQRVPQLITVLKTDPSESAREKAAAELRDYDPTAFPEITAVLVDVLQHDPKPGVRVEAAQSLSKLRPVSQEAGMALEEATRDSSLRVRWQARSSLLSYRLSGYRSQKPADGLRGPDSSVPGQAGAGPFSGRISASPRTTRVYVEGETPPPPLAPSLTAADPARPEPRPAIQPTKAEPRPLPQLSSTDPRPSSQPPAPETRPTPPSAPAPKPPAPAPSSPDAGPDLPPG
jgi:HEAT repeats